MIVVDASVVIELLLGGGTSTRIADRAFAPGEALYAPHLLDLEVAQFFRRAFLAGHVSENRAVEALQDFLALRVRRYPHFVLLPRIWQLRHNLTAYDAAYVSLAEQLGAPLVTRDAALAGAAGHFAAIELL